MQETVLLNADGIYRWNGPKAKSTLAGTKLGRLVLTNHRLLFLSSGTNDVSQRVTAAARRGAGAGIRAAGTTDHLDVSALQSEGSLSVPLVDLDRAVFVKKRFKNYLTVRFTGSTGTSEEYAFMNQWVIPGGITWQEEIERAKQQERRP